MDSQDRRPNVKHALLRLLSGLWAYSSPLKLIDFSSKIAYILSFLSLLLRRVYEPLGIIEIQGAALPVMSIPSYDVHINKSGCLSLVTLSTMSSFQCTE